MKKIFGLFAAATMIFAAASCQKETGLEPSAYDGTVTFSVSLPDAIATKAAVGDVSAVTKLHYEVYEGTTDDLGACVITNGAKDFNVEHQIAQVKLELINDQSYVVIFWADHDTYYNTDDLRNISFKSDVDVKSNEADREAFYKVVSIDNPENLTAEDTAVELVRPFAQLNLGTTNPTYAGATLAPTSSTVTVDGLSSTFNTISGVGGAAEELTFAENAVIGNTLEVAGTTYDLAAMNYLFVPNGEANATVTYTLELNNAATTAVENTIIDVPFKTNYRTNIVGNLLTSTKEYTITIDTDFNKEADGTDLDIYSVSSVDDLRSIINAAGEVPVYIVLQNDFNIDATSGGIVINNVITKSQTATANKDITIDLNGKNINAKIGDGTEARSIFNLKGGQSLTITGKGNVHCEFGKNPNTVYAFINNEGGNVTINGGYYTMDAPRSYIVDGVAVSIIPTFIDNNTASLEGEANVVINGGTFTWVRNLFRNYPGTTLDANLTINGGTFNGEADDPGCIWNQWASGDGCLGYLTINGGTFNNIYIDNDGRDDQHLDIAIDIPRSADAALTNPVALLYVSNAEELQTALNSNESVYIIFSEDIEGNVTVTQNEGIDLIVDGADKKFDGTFYLQGNSRHNGAETLVFRNINFEHLDATAIDFISCDKTSSLERYAHNVTVENCSFKGNSSAAVLGMRYRQCYNMSVVDCTAENLFLLVWTNGGNSITVDGVEAVNCGEGGLSTSTTALVNISNTTITSSTPYGYGVRANSSDDANDIVLNVENCNFDADVPVLLRKANNHSYTINLTGTNTLTTELPYQIVATGGEYKAGVELTLPACNLKLNITGAEGFKVYPNEVSVSTNDDLAAALKISYVVYIKMTNRLLPSAAFSHYNKIIDGQGNYIWGGTFNSINTSGGTIQNLGFWQAEKAINIVGQKSKVVLDNVKVVSNYNCNYAIHADEGNGSGLEATDCEFYSHIAYVAALGNAKFTNCTFGANKNGSTNLTAYAPTEFVGCEFKSGYPISAIAACTFENCTLDGVAITAENLATLVTEGTANATVK